MADTSPQSKGGRARAESLPAAKRQEIARDAAHARWEVQGSVDAGDVRRAVAVGELHIGDLSIPCAVLEDGTRVISERGMGEALGRKFGGANWRRKGEAAGADQLPYFLGGRALKTFVENDLELLTYEPILYRHPRNKRVANGVKAELIPNICDVWLKSRDAGLLRKSQLRIAQNAEVLVRGLAHVGIIALVDEATGYQQRRERDELQRILSAYISEELLPWAKRFPDEFYREMFRLWGWQYPPKGSQGRGGPRGTRHAGKLTKQLVYDRLPPGVIQELERKNPADEKWQRRARHHQFLTDDIGHPHLEKHIAVVTAFMRVSPNWRAFMRLFNKNSPPPEGYQTDIEDLVERDISEQQEDD